MTPAEFVATVDGHRRAEDKEWYRTAWTVAHLVNMVSQTPITPERLLGRVTASGVISAHRGNE